MKNIILILWVALCFTACKKSPQETASISGTIDGIGTDTFYLYGADNLYDHIDTIPVKEGHFTHTLKVDTITSAFLLIDKRIEYPIFIDKRNKITIKGDTAHLNSLTVDGNIYNQELTAFNQMLANEGSNAELAEKKAEEFIRNHNSSYVSIYLLDKYFVQSQHPNYEKIQELMEKMSGVLQDKTYIENITEKARQEEKIQKGRYAPYFLLPSPDNEKVSRTNPRYKDKNLLFCFWASWADSIGNRNNHKELKELYRTYKNNKYFEILGISFDYDKQQWLDAIARDTLKWEQVRSNDGGNSSLIQQYGIQKLPYNILVSPQGRIIAKNLHGKELAREVEKAVKDSERKKK